MRRPSSVRVGHTRYRVRWSKTAVAELTRDIAGAAVSMRRAMIAVEPTGNAQADRELLVHELLHACLWDAALPLGRDQEERVVATLAPRLLALLQGNPGTVRYLLDRSGAGHGNAR